MTLKELQTAVKKSKLNAYIVTRSNMFIGQDLLDDENPLRALTGFSGSAGTLVVTPDKAFLLVDGRYEIQAARQTNPDEVKIICGRNNLLAQCLTGLFGGKPAKVGFNSFTNAVRGIERLAERFPDIAFIPDTSQIFANNIFGRPCRVLNTKSNFAASGATKNRQHQQPYRFLRLRRLPLHGRRQRFLAFKHPFRRAPRHAAGPCLRAVGQRRTHYPVRRQPEL